MVDRRATGIAEVEEAGHLVERLAGGVVDRLADQPVVAVPAHLDEHRVPAGHEQHHERELEVGVFEERRVEVRLEVVHADERHVPRQRQRLRRRHADEQRADQAGPDRARHAVDPRIVDAGLDDRAGDHGVEHVEVRPRGDLGHDATELGVQIDLRRHDARHDVEAAHHQRRRGLVAARLDAEHERRLVDASRLSIAPGASSARIRSSCSPYSSLVRSLHHMTIASSCSRSSGGGSRPARTRTGGTAPGRRCSTPGPRASTPCTARRRPSSASASSRCGRDHHRVAGRGQDGDVRDVRLAGTEPQPGVPDDLAAPRGPRRSAATPPASGRSRSRTRPATTAADS